MSQGFQAGRPLTNSAAASLEVRSNFDALLSNHNGNLPPGYLVPGSTYFGQPNSSTSWPGGGHLHVAKNYGLNPYGFWNVGGSLRLYMNAILPGTNGNTIAPSVKVATNGFIGGFQGIFRMESANTVFNVIFNNTLSPSFHAAQAWTPTGVSQPALVADDGILLGKVWDIVPITPGFLQYASGKLLSGPGFPVDLHLVDLEKKMDIYSLAPTQGQDHVVVDGFSQGNAAYWWEAQDGLYRYSLIENGIPRDYKTFKVIPITHDGVSVSFVVYNVLLGQVNLVPFNILSSLELHITKGV